MKIIDKIRELTIAANDERIQPSERPVLFVSPDEWEELMCHYATYGAPENGDVILVYGWHIRREEPLR